MRRTPTPWRIGYTDGGALGIWSLGCHTDDPDVCLVALVPDEADVRRAEMIVEAVHATRWAHEPPWTSKVAHCHARLAQHPTAICELPRGHAGPHLDSVQVRMNGGPPCFSEEDAATGWACSRAERWHGLSTHAFVPESGTELDRLRLLVSSEYCSHREPCGPGVPECYCYGEGPHGAAAPEER